MVRGSIYAVATAAALALVACSERQPESTTGPQFAQGTDPCAFSNSIVTGYFPSSRQSSALSLKQSMGDAGHGTIGARDFGFKLMDSIGSVSRSFAVSASAGAQLTVAVIGCMFDNASTFTYPTDAVSDFTAALTNVTGGAYYVRGGGREGTVLGRLNPPGDASGNLSGIAPSTTSWTGVLPAGVAEGRALLYGYPVSNPPRFEWATVPSELTFSAPIVVSVCDLLDPSGTSVNEEAVGVLTLVNSSICSTTQTQTMIDPGWGPNALFARLSRVVVSALTPEPLQATALATSTGGKTSTIPKSEFGNTSVTDLTLVWNENPGVPSTWNGTTQQYARPTSAYVTASTTDGSQPVRFCAYLSGTNNNGTPTKLMNVTDPPSPQQDPECTTPPNGDPNALSVVTKIDPADHSRSIADFGNVWDTKTGTITITLTVVSGTAVTNSLSVQANVKPALKK